MFLTKVLKNAKKVQDLIPKFENLIGKDGVKTATAIRDQYSHDECHHEPSLPDLVVIPKNVEEVSGIVRICNENKIPVIPFGTGTGIEGGVVPIKGGVTIDLKAMDQILQVNEEDFDCTVQPGVTRKRLNEAIRDTGLFFTVDPGADASICGMVATGASGTTSVRYGTMKSNVKNLEVVLPNGDILYTKGKDRRPWKSSAGYNLTDLFIGQEGTLGIITSACVQLHPRPLVISAAVCSFDSIRHAVESVVQIRQCSIPMARIEFLDSQQVEACNKFVQKTGGKQREVKPTLFLEFHGSTQNDVEDQAKTAAEICTSNNGTSFEWSTDQVEINNLWSTRHNALYAIVSQRKNCRGFSTDVCVPTSHLANIIDETRKDMDENGLFGTIVGHVGEGNFHCIFPVDEHDKNEMKTIWEFSDRLVKRALSVGGTCTGEHGIGLGKREYLKDEFGKVGYDLMKTIKKTLDPNNIMNPGKVIDLEN
uniref:FAD-binding PCMH-type domain-containing protein n=1 Tax=Panagrolaimus sp. JU765 TaxID=591449 RepID=A0AC34R333_9BILA